MLGSLLPDDVVFDILENVPIYDVLKLRLCSRATNSSVIRYLARAWSVNYVTAPFLSTHSPSFNVLAQKTAMLITGPRVLQILLREKLCTGTLETAVHFSFENTVTEWLTTNNLRWRYLPPEEWDLSQTTVTSVVEAVVLERKRFHVVFTANTPLQYLLETYPSKH